MISINNDNELDLNEKIMKRNEELTNDIIDPSSSKEYNIQKLIDNMEYKGSIGRTGTIISIPLQYSKWDTYKVITAGYHAGMITKAGDMLVCISDCKGKGKNSDWARIISDVSQVNTKQDIEFGRDDNKVPSTHDINWAPLNKPIIIPNQGRPVVPDKDITDFLRNLAQQPSADPYKSEPISIENIHETAFIPFYRRQK